MLKTAISILVIIFASTVFAESHEDCLRRKISEFRAEIHSKRKANAMVMNDLRQQEEAAQDEELSIDLAKQYRRIARVNDKLLDDYLAGVTEGIGIDFSECQ
jgi:hypothetical protein